MHVPCPRLQMLLPWSALQGVEQRGKRTAPFQQAPSGEAACGTRDPAKRDQGASEGPDAQGEPGVQGQGTDQEKEGQCHEGG